MAGPPAPLPMSQFGHTRQPNRASALMRGNGPELWRVPGRQAERAAGDRTCAKYRSASRARSAVCESISVPRPLEAAGALLATHNVHDQSEMTFSMERRGNQPGAAAIAICDRGACRVSRAHTIGSSAGAGAAIGVAPPPRRNHSRRFHYRDGTARAAQQLIPAFRRRRADAGAFSASFARSRVRTLVDD